MIVLVAGERKAEALHRVAEKTDRPVVIDRLERFQDAWDVVAAEIAHQRGEFVVAAPLDQLGDIALVADIVQEAFAPRRAALERQRGIELVRRVVDPLLQPFAAGLGERGLLQLAVFENDEIPAHRGKSFSKRVCRSSRTTASRL